MKNQSDQKTKKIHIDTTSLQTNYEKKPAGTQDIRTANRKNKTQRKSCCSGCGCALVLLILVLAIYLFSPFTSRFLLLGIDRAPSGTMAGRSDTMMAVSVNPLAPVVKVLSIPRDLWVPIQGFKENRINTAHFFAEAQQTGKGPEAAIQTVNSNFDFNLKYYLRFNLENFPQVIDSLGGITLTLSQPMSGYQPGSYQLDGSQALAFVRSRSDGDDFFRMSQGQVFIAGFIRRLIEPEVWARLPKFFMAIPNAVDTNIPVWLWPRLGLAMARASFTGFESLMIDRNMVTPSVTSQGAQILIPNWPLINAYISEHFR